MHKPKVVKRDGYWYVFVPHGLIPTRCLTWDLAIFLAHLWWRNPGVTRGWK